MYSFTKPSQSGENSGFSRKVSELREGLKLIVPDQLAERTGTDYTAINSDSGKFHLMYFSTKIVGLFPEMKFQTTLGDDLPEFQQLMFLYYFATSDGSALTGKYVSFAELPGGRMYNSAFQGYSGDEIVRSFGENIVSFRDACKEENGESIKLADAAFSFHVLPRITVQLIYWLGDDEFPSSCKVLFDSVATHYIPLDGCAIIGSNLVRRIIKSASS